MWGDKLLFVCDTVKEKNLNDIVLTLYCVCCMWRSFHIWLEIYGFHFIYTCIVFSSTALLISMYMCKMDWMYTSYHIEPNRKKKPYIQKELFSIMCWNGKEKVIFLPFYSFTEYRSIRLNHSKKKEKKI